LVPCRLLSVAFSSDIFTALKDTVIPIIRISILTLGKGYGAVFGYVHYFFVVKNIVYKIKVEFVMVFLALQTNE